MSITKMSCFLPPYPFIKYSNRAQAILSTHVRPKLLEILSTNGLLVGPIKETHQAQMVLVVLVEIQGLVLRGVGWPLTSLLSPHVVIFSALYLLMVTYVCLIMMQWSWLEQEDRILVACYAVVGHQMER